VMNEVMVKQEVKQLPPNIIVANQTHTPHEFEDSLVLLVKHAGVEVKQEGTCFMLKVTG